MSKEADEYLIVNPWKVIEKDWHKDRNMVSESIFSLGNEYMGVRGCFEEGVTEETLAGSYFNGVYEVEPVENTSYKGIVQKTHFMVNAANWLYTRISADGELLEPGVSSISDFQRELDLKTGILSRSYIWNLKDGLKLKVSFIRFLNMIDPELGYQKIAISNLSEAEEQIDLKITLGVDGKAIHAGRRKCYWKELSTAASSCNTNCGISDNKATESTENVLPFRSAYILEQTKTTKQRLFSGFVYELSKDTKIDKCLTLSDDCFSGFDICLSVQKNESVEIKRKGVNIVEKNLSVSNESVVQKGISYLNKVSQSNFDNDLNEQKQYWSDFWHDSDIEIDGDEKNQQGIRFCIFQMHQTYHGYNSANNIGAKGLTGEAYNGHTFWDTETCCLPFFLFSNLKAAKNLLEYRYSTLKQAKERAIQLDCEGACYPVATLNGEEACNLWQHASLQFQPSTGVAYGIHHYVTVSGDIEFLFGHGVEMLVEISRFLVKRGSWNQDKSGFGFYGVMGPDEFHMMVNNNTYTNFMAKQTFDYTIETLNNLKKENHERFVQLVDDLNISDEELANIALCSRKMIILYDSKTKLYEQHEGYFNLPHIDVNKIPITDFPLYNNWSYDRIYRTDMIKQPDVLMFIYLHSSLFPLNVKLSNYEYYEPKTIHESSLSPSIHSILASEIGKPEEAFKFFAFATRMDLDNYNRNTKEGLHTTSIAAAWINIVYGFGGMRSDGNVLSFNPSRPKIWKKYSFRIVYKESVINVTVTEDVVIFTSSKENIPVRIYGRDYILNPCSLSIQLQK